MNNSANIKFDKNAEIKIRCMGRFHTKITNYQMCAELTFDTGAAFTAIPANVLGISKKDLLSLNCSQKVGYRISDNKEEGLIFYKIQLDSFSIAGMDFKSVPIYITFDKRYDSLLLGRDFSGLMDYTIKNSTKTMTLTKTPRFIEYQRTNDVLDNPQLLSVYEETDDMFFISLKDEPQCQKETNVEKDISDDFGDR